MKTLFVLQPGEGHLNPMIPLAHRLSQGGHQVAFAVAPSFRALVETHGFTTFPAGLDWLESKSRESFAAARTLSLRDLGRWFLCELFADSAVHAMVPDLLAIVESWRPDVLIRNDYEFASCIVSEISGIPHATVGVSFVWTEARLRDLLEAPLAFARSAFGLSPYPALDMLYPYLYLSYVPASWQPRCLRVLHSVRPEPVVKSAPGRFLDREQYRRDLPTVYASMGTVNNTLPRLFPTVIEALREEPINLILTIGRGEDCRQWGPQPPNVQIEPYIPQDEVLPHCDLFITSSSFFTVVGSVMHEVPVLMAPITGDESTQAHRFAELALGKVMRQPGTFEPPLSEEVPVFGVQSLRSMVREMMGTSRYRRRVSQAREEINGLPSLAEAVQLLERLAAERQPLLSEPAVGRSLSNGVKGG